MTYMDIYAYFNNTHNIIILCAFKCKLLTKVYSFRKYHYVYYGNKLWFWMVTRVNSLGMFKKNWSSILNNYMAINFLYGETYFNNLSSKKQTLISLFLIGWFASIFKGFQFGFHVQRSNNKYAIEFYLSSFIFHVRAITKNHQYVI
jgi:hypothetical protein